MRIIADENIPYLKEFFSTFGEVVPVNGRKLRPEQLTGADVLLVRSVTPVNAGLLGQSPVRFVGTCTIGTDHLDIDYLQQQGIAHASAPGCNAGGVVQYVLTALSRLRADWLDLKVGIVGCGNVGRRLYRTLRDLGVDCVGYDPFLQSTDELRLVPFDELLQSDAICLHAPLSREGPYPTEYMFDQAVLAQLRPGTFLLNAGRGGVLDNRALLAHLQAGGDLQVVLDVWENEPDIDSQLARSVGIATPHIAGYSDEGRINGSVMICHSLAQFLDWDTADIERHLTTVQREIGDKGGEIEVNCLEQALSTSYDIGGDHQRLMAAVNGLLPLGGAFDNLRKLYPERHEPAYYRALLPTADSRLQAQLQAVGFQLGATD